ncbi:MAG: ABC transporter ATP-binding protein [Deltaproteobacteria bacterium]|nr:MAG: ABC transporter ATP-binding protein [Deltaproteobacteria bacterium]
MIRFDSVHKYFGSDSARVHALRGVSLRIPAGQMCAIMGPSGAGKSTLLHVATGLLPFDGGRIQIGEHDIGAMDASSLALLRRRTVGLVTQFSNLVPFLSVYDNVVLPLRLDRMFPPDEKTRAEKVLDMVGLSPRARHKPPQLSGGELQRAAVARALIASPSVVFADEPTGNLDSAGARQIMQLLRTINQETNVTIVVVTHDPVWASICDRVVRLVDGAIEQDLALGEADRDG